MADRSQVEKLPGNQKKWKRREQHVKTPGDEKYFSPWKCAVQRMLPGVQKGTCGESMRKRRSLTVEQF